MNYSIDENKNNKYLSKKIFFLIIAILFLFLLAGLFIIPKFTMFSIREYETEGKYIEQNIPVIGSGEEISHLGYKLSNSSGIIISTIPTIYCSWKSTNQDDGYKSCTAIFEITDKQEQKKLLKNPKVLLDFAKDNAKNIDISYSIEYELINSTYNNLSENEISYSVSERTSNYSSSSSEENKAYNKNPKFLSNTNKKSIVYIDNKVTYSKRRFFNFKHILTSTLNITNENSTIDNNTLIGDNNTYSLINNTNESSPNDTDDINSTYINNTDSNTTSITDIQVNSSVNDSTKSGSSEENISTSGSEDSSNTNPDGSTSSEPVTDDFSTSSQDQTNQDSTNTQSEQEQVQSGINGFVTKLLGGESTNLDPKNPTIDSSKPFAVKVSFEMPKYQDNSFNFSISEGNFSASIDPGISPCGILDEENGHYTLTEDVSSTGSCFEIQAPNIVLDCNSHSISFTSPDTVNSFGIVSYSPNTTIKNCFVSDVNEPDLYGKNIYLSDSAGSVIFNNTLTSVGSVGSGIFIEDSPNSQIYDNYIDFLGVGHKGIYISENSENTRLTNNNIFMDAPFGAGVFITNSNLIYLKDNEIHTIEESDPGIFIGASEDSTIFNNSITTDGQDSYGIFTSSTTRSNVSNNLIKTLQESSYGINMVNFSNLSVISNNHLNIGTSGYSSGINLEFNSYYNNIKNNLINVTGSSGDGIYLNNMRYNNLENNTIIAAVEGIYMIYSIYNNFSNNNISLFGDDGAGFYILYSGSAQIFNNSIFTTGTSSNGIFIGSMTDTYLDNNDIHTNGLDSNGIMIIGDSSEDIFSNNNIDVNNGNGLNLEYCINLSFVNNNISISGQNKTSVFISEIYESNFKYNQLYLNNMEDKGYEIDRNSQLNQILNTRINDYNQSSKLLKIMSNNTSLDVYDSNLSSENNNYGFYVLENTFGGVWNFINTTISNLYWQSSSTGEINNFDYILIFANYTNGTSIQGLNITVYDSFDNLVFTDATDENGFLKKMIRKSHQISPDMITYDHNYTLVYDFNDMLTYSSINISDKPLIFYTFNETIPINNSINATNSYNRSYESLLSNSRSSLNISSGSRLAILNSTIVNRKILFDINLKIIKKDVSNKEKLMATIGLINVGSPGKVNASVNYKIKDSNNIIVSESDEIVPIETQTEFIKELDISSLNKGNYTLIANLSYLGQIDPAVASDVFTINDNKVFVLANMFNQRSIDLLISVVLIAILIILVIIKINQDYENQED